MNDTASAAWEMLGATLRARGERLLLIEASAGGALSAAATAAPGASAWFAGALLPYADALKQRWLGVAPELIVAHGAVSTALVEALLRGAATHLGGSPGWLFAESGIYGPGGARPGKAVGTMVVGVCDPQGRIECAQWQLSGERAQLRSQMQARVAAWLQAAVKAAA